MQNTSEFLPPAPINWRIFLAVSISVLVLAHLADSIAWQFLRDPRVNEREWGRLLRSVGYVPTWIFGSAALWLMHRSCVVCAKQGNRCRALSLLFAPALAGGVAELTKILVRRHRPGAEVHEYIFRPYDVDFWSTRGLGLASSHTAVAFGAAAILARCFPGTGPVWYALAGGCALTRILAGAHYLSDVVAAGIIGWLTAALVWSWFHRKVA